MTTTLTRRLLLGLAAAALLLVAVPAPAPADRAVPGYTLKTITAGDVTSMAVSRQSDGEGGVAIVVTWSYEVKDSTGAVRYSSSVSKELTTAERNQLLTFATNVGLPLANAQDGL